jgi:hypothetical protein
MVLNNWEDVKAARERVDEAVSLAAERLEVPSELTVPSQVIARAILDAAVIVVSELRVLGVTISHAADTFLYETSQRAR